MYYPLEKIITNLYTSGNSFYVTATGEDYRGDYYSTYDGKFFTGKSPSNQSREIKQYNTSSDQNTTDSQAKVYNRLGSNTDKATTINYYTPTPTQQDYDNGYILRYFCNRVNGDVSTIKEVDKQTYDSLYNNTLYSRVGIVWMISGKIEDYSIKNSILPIPGVLKRNKQAVDKAESVITGIRVFLKNLLEFHK